LPPPKGLTAQPEKLTPLEPQAPQKDAPGTPGTAGTPGANGPEGPIAGGVAGLGSDEPFAYDYYTSLVVNRLQEAWQNRPILPAGSDTVRVVVLFVINDDGRVTESRSKPPAATRRSTSRPSGPCWRSASSRPSRAPTRRTG